jgi:hypothetical protein
MSTRFTPEETKQIREVLNRTGVGGSILQISDEHYRALICALPDRTATKVIEHRRFDANQ